MTNMTDFHDAMEALRIAEEQAMREMTGLLDWNFRDFPRCSRELYDLFVATIGGENLHWIALTLFDALPATDKRPAVPESYRGQVMISPEGVRRAGEYLAANPASE